MTPEKLTSEEKKIAYQLWEMSFDDFNNEHSPVERTRAFHLAPQTVREALYYATQQPQHRGHFSSNPFDSSTKN